MNLLLVCGGRWYGHPKTRTGNTNIHASEQERTVWRELTRLRERHYFEGVVDGCATGADTCAHGWAVRHGMLGIRVPPQPGESPMLRNLRMWRTWRDSVYGLAAFPGGTGTANMVEVFRKESPHPVYLLPLTDPDLFSRTAQPTL